MNIKWFRIFKSLYETENFTYTAHLLNMTQAGISQHIKQLEEYLNTSLIFREKKQFIITEAGERFYVEACAIIAQIDSLPHLLKDDKFDHGEIRLMSPGSVGLNLYPALLGYQNAHRGLSIDYKFNNNLAIEHALQAKEIHIGLMTKKPDSPLIQFLNIANEELLLITPKKTKVIDWATLNHMGYIGHPDGDYHISLLLKENFSEFKEISQLRMKGFSNQIHLILEPVKLGLGFTVLPSNAVAAFHDQEALQIHKLDKRIFENLFLCYLDSLTQPARIENIKQVIINFLTENNMR